MKRIKEFFGNLREGQKAFGGDISTVINSTLLTFVYIFGVGSSYLISKISKKELLEAKLDKESKTYWKDLNLSKGKMEEYYRQF